MKREIKKLYKKDDNLYILDAGMGFGQYTYFLTRYFVNPKIKAVDIKEDQIRDCQYFFNRIGKVNVCVEYADLREISYKNEFDLILSVDVMEHIVEDQKVFNNFFLALKNGGYLIVNTPSDIGGSDVHSEDEKSFIEEHARDGYSINDLEFKLNISGFKVVKHKYSYGKFGRIYWLLAMKYPISLIGQSKIFFLILPFYYILTLIPILTLMLLDYSSNNKTGSGLIVIAKKL